MVPTMFEDSVLMSSPDTTPPPEIPGYELIEKIGEGGMGEVFRAKQVAPSRQVAIKFLMPVPVTNESVPELLQRETTLMEAIDHPNVVAILDWGQVEDRFFLVMEYVPGSTLRSLMKKGEPWEADKALEVLNAIARALTYIHSQDILHLDLKPENVMRSKDGMVKITDFGLALSRFDAWTLSELGLAQGTLDYCSPEQRYGLPIDQRADLFSLATVAYEMLTGTLPGRVFMSACSRNPLLGSEIDPVLKKGLARDPDERYRTVEEFRRDLSAALESQGE